MPLAYASVLTAGFCWAIATQIFSHLARQTPSPRLNFYKAIVSLIFFIPASWWFGFHIPLNGALTYLFLSGVAGFAIGDILIFYAFARVGAARTLMISSFEPTLVAIYSFFILGHTLAWIKLIGLFFLMLCLVFLSLDKKLKIKFSWTAAGIAFLGFAFDGLGIVLTKKAFLLDPSLNSATANTFRVAMAIIALFILNRWRQDPLSPHDIPQKSQLLLVLGSFFGTFMALLLYIFALSHLDAPVCAAMGSLAPVWGSIYEHIRDRVTPSRWFLAAMACVGCGVFILLKFG